MAESDLVQEPCKNDVLCGRGGSINSHPGNERFRLLVEKRKRVYLTARFKREKRLIASSIVSEIRALDPPGRFLARDSKAGCWKDIGDEKARDKTSQALRENAPSIRAEIETEINEQRAEMQREEPAPQQPQQPPPPQPQHQPPSYYNGGWGSYPYYGNYHAPPPQGYGPPPAGHGYPHHPPQPHYDYTHPTQPLPPGHAPPHAHYYVRPDPYTSKSVADIVNSGAESIKNWATSSLSGVFPSGASQDGQDNRSVNSKPLSYVHEGNSRKRRMVKFRDDPRTSRRTASTMNSIVSESPELEPEQLDESGDASNSVLAHFADRVMGSLGSFDAMGSMCGTEANGSNYKIPFPVPSGGFVPQENMDDDMEGVQWEGQEVQLVDRNLSENLRDERTMPPPAEVRPRSNHYDAASSVGFSSIGSCHSWFPEQISAASSFFRGGGSVGSHEGNQSVGGNNSLGGNSLMRVFDNDAAMNDAVARSPSWERSSFRSRSPLHFGSDDESLVSKGSNKSGSIASRSMDMMWESRT